MPALTMPHPPPDLVLIGYLKYGVLVGPSYVWI